MVFVLSSAMSASVRALTLAGILAILINSSNVAATCLATDFIFDETTKQLRIPASVDHVCVGGPCPSNLPPSTPLYVAPGYGIALGAETVWRVGTSEVTLEHYNATTNLYTRLATFLGEAGYFGDGVINRATSNPTGFHFLGRRSSGFATGAQIWVKTHEADFSSPDGSILGLLQFVYLYGRPSIRGIRLVPSGTASFMPMVITASQAIYGNVTLDGILKNRNAPVISGGAHVYESLFVKPVTEQPIYAPINGSTSMLTIEYFETNCFTYTARHRHLNGFSVADPAACFVIADHVFLDKLLDNPAGLGVKFTTGCASSNPMDVLVYPQADCTGTAVTVSVTMGTCLATLVRGSCINYT